MASSLNLDSWPKYHLQGRLDALLLACFGIRDYDHRDNRVEAVKAYVKVLAEVVVQGSVGEVVVAEAEASAL